MPHSVRIYKARAQYLYYGRVAHTVSANPTYLRQAKWAGR